MLVAHVLQKQAYKYHVSMDAYTVCIEYKRHLSPPGVALQLVISWTSSYPPPSLRRTDFKACPPPPPALPPRGEGQCPLCGIPRLLDYPMLLTPKETISETFVGFCEDYLLSMAFAIQAFTLFCSSETIYGSHNFLKLNF
jgi:hypothetical protein